MSQDYKGIFFGIENPLLDISADVPRELVTKYKGAFGNAILASEEQMPLYEELTKNYKVTYSAGGATLNVLRVFQWMLQQGKGCSTFVGCVGNDKFGEELKQAAEHDGVVTELLVDQETPTGTCAVLVVDKERSLITNLGAANKYKHEHLLLPKTQEEVKKAQYYYSSGYFLTVSPPSAIHVAQHAADNNKVFMTNLSAMFICEFFKEPLLKLLPYADFVFGNEDEARTFAKVNALEKDDTAFVASYVAKLDKVNKQRPRVVCFTQGPGAVVLATFDPQSGAEPTVKLIPVTPIAAERLVDTNGAGDAFCGGFIAQLVQGKPLETCVAAGIYASGEIIQRSGCTFPEKPHFQE